MKQKIREILPEDYEILGKINILISTEGPKDKVLHKTFKTKNELSKKELEYLQNMRNLLSYDNENPYERIISVETLPKESLKLNITGDYKLLSVKSLSKEDFEWFDTETNTMRPIEGDYEILYGGTSELKQLKAIPVIVK